MDQQEKHDLAVARAVKVYRLFSGDATPEIAKDVLAGLQDHVSKISSNSGATYSENCVHNAGARSVVKHIIEMYEKGRKSANGHS